MSSQATLFSLAPANTLSILPAPAPSITPTRPGVSPVDQVRRAFAPQRRLSAALGFILGGFVPVATFTIVHHEVATYPLLWILVAGGLLYSALSVYTWAKQTFTLTAKALGFVLLTEGAVTFAHTSWLSVAGLTILVTINGICATVALQTRR
jgi:hypothetical protein